MTTSAVLNPGRKISSRVSASLIRAASSVEYNSQLDRLGADFLHIDAAPIVTDLDHHLIALMQGMQPDLSSRWLAQTPALLRRFNAVTDCIANQMGERFGNRVENALVEVGFLSAEFKIHFAPTLPGHIAHDARKAPEQLIDRHHADLHHGALQIVQNPRLEGHGVGKLTAQQFLGIALAKLIQRLLQHRLADDEFSHQIEDVVDASRFHSQDIFRDGLRREFWRGI